MNIFRLKGTTVKSGFLAIISHLGPTHLQRVSPSLGESLWRIGPPIYPSLFMLAFNETMPCTFKLCYQFWKGEYIMLHTCTCMCVLTLTQTRISSLQKRQPQALQTPKAQAQLQQVRLAQQAYSARSTSLSQLQVTSTSYYCTSSDLSCYLVWVAWFFQAFWKGSASHGSAALTFACSFDLFCAHLSLEALSMPTTT